MKGLAKGGGVLAGLGVGGMVASSMGDRWSDQGRVKGIPGLGAEYLGASGDMASAVSGGSIFGAYNTAVDSSDSKGGDTGNVAMMLGDGGEIGAGFLSTVAPEKFKQIAKQYAESRKSDTNAMSTERGMKAARRKMSGSADVASKVKQIVESLNSALGDDDPKIDVDAFMSMNEGNLDILGSVADGKDLNELLSNLTGGKAKMGRMTSTAGGKDKILERVELLNKAISDASKKVREGESGDAVVKEKPVPRAINFDPAFYESDDSIEGMSKVEAGVDARVAAKKGLPSGEKLKAWTEEASADPIMGNAPKDKKTKPTVSLEEIYEGGLSKKELGQASMARRRRSPDAERRIRKHGGLITGSGGKKFFGEELKGDDTLAILSQTEKKGKTVYEKAAEERRAIDFATGTSKKDIRKRGGRIIGADAGSVYGDSLGSDDISRAPDEYGIAGMFDAPKKGDGGPAEAIVSAPVVKRGGDEASEGLKDARKIPSVKDARVDGKVDVSITSDSDLGKLLAMFPTLDDNLKKAIEVIQKAANSASGLKDGAKVSSKLSMKAA